MFPATDPASGLDPELRPQRSDKGLRTSAYIRMGPTVHSSGATSLIALIDFLHASLLQTAVICASVGSAIDVGSYPGSARHNVTFPVTKSFDNATVLQGAAAMLEKAATTKSRADPNAMFILCNRSLTWLARENQTEVTTMYFPAEAVRLFQDCATRYLLET